MAIKNRYEYLSGILEALDVEHTEAEVHNNEVWRSKVLDGMGVEHTYDDINQTDLWRAKVVEGIGNMSGGGGGDFTTANVTIVSANQGKVGTMFYGLMTPYYAYRAEAFAVGNGDTVIPIILIEGQILLTAEEATLTIASTSGAITYDSEASMYTITGDCTITIS